MSVALSSVKSSHWQITYFPPEECQGSVEDAKDDVQKWVSVALPPGWSFGSANVEKCPESGRYHYQGYLKTAYVRGTDVKRVIGDRAHIEKTRNQNALVNYSNKADTRVATVDAPQGVPQPWDYITTLAGRWDNDEFLKLLGDHSRKFNGCLDEAALCYVDAMVAEDIANGARGVEFIAVNPMFRSAWKKFWKYIIIRDGKRKNAEEVPASCAEEDGSSSES